MTINDIANKFFSCTEFSFCLHGNYRFTLHHDLGAVIESPEGIFLISNCYQGDTAKYTEIQQFLSSFNHTKVLTIDLGDEALEHIFKLHDFADDDK